MNIFSTHKIYLVEKFVVGCRNSVGNKHRLWKIAISCRAYVFHPRCREAAFVIDTLSHYRQSDIHRQFERRLEM